METAFEQPGSHPESNGFAWQMSLRLMGWIGIAASMIGMAALAFGAESSADSPHRLPIAVLPRVVEAVIPLVIGIQAAFALSPDDEPLEVLLACSRPLWWLLLERLAVIVGVLAAIALLGTGVISLLSDRQEALTAIARWLSPAVFFAGLGAYITLKSRQPSFSTALVGVAWFIFGFAGPALLPGYPTFKPLDIIQPHIWIINPYLQPGDLTLSDFWINRVVVIAVGFGLLLLAARTLNNEEQILLGTRKSS